MNKKITLKIMTPLKEIYFNLLKLERLRLTLIYSSKDLGTNVRLYFQAQSIISLHTYMCFTGPVVEWLASRDTWPKCLCATAR